MPARKLSMLKIEYVGFLVKNQQQCQDYKKVKQIKTTPPDFVFSPKIFPLKKILIIRFSSIGDIVLTTPVVRCLKKQLKGCEVHYLTRQAFQPVLKNNPYIDKIITMKKSVTEVIPALRNEGYDHIVDLHKNFRSYAVRSKLKTAENKRNFFSQIKRSEVVTGESQTECDACRSHC